MPRVPSEYLYSVIIVCSGVKCNTLNFDSRWNIDGRAIITTHIGGGFFNDNRITPITSRDRYTPWPFRFEAKSQLLLGWGSPMARVKFTRIVARRGSFVLRVRACQHMHVWVVSFPCDLRVSHTCVPDRWIGELHHACSPGTIPVVWSSAVRVPVTRN